MLRFAVRIEAGGRREKVVSNHASLEATVIYAEMSVKAPRQVFTAEKSWRERGG